jgi:dihydroxyacetone kinase phosphoprotein-dependent L subunit
MVSALTPEQTKNMLLAVADYIIEQKPYLTEIDSKIGDGDHGIGMSGGLSKAKEKLLGLENPADINILFKTTGMAMLNSMGGASGVIFGTLFLGGVKGLESKPQLDCAVFTQLMRGALNAIKERGKAQVGDKTMVDALEPAVLAMESADQADLAALLALARDAAKKGMEETKNYVAKFGRAKSLMERSIGYQDAGATSVYLIFSAMTDYVEAL